MNENEVFDTEQNAPEIPDAQKEFLDNLKHVNSSYLSCVETCACIALCGIVLAVQFFLWIGIGVALLSAILYVFYTKFILQKKLGISYQTTSGALTVTKLCPKDKEEIFVPRRLLWLDVDTLSDKAFSCECAKNMHSVHLPATLTKIGKDVFEGCDALKTVYFEGTQEDFEKIESDTSFERFELIFCDCAEYEIKKPPKAKKDKKIKKDKNGNNVTDTAPTDTEEIG